MSGNYRFSWLRPGGWGRLGLVGALAVIFAAPMLWALGLFGEGDEALRRAIVFAISGSWAFTAVGYAFGWALRGFVVRAKEHEDEEEGARRPAAAHGPAHPPAAHPPAGRPAGH